MIHQEQVQLRGCIYQTISIKIKVLLTRVPYEILILSIKTDNYITKMRDFLKITIFILNLVWN